MTNAFQMSNCSLMMISSILLATLPRFYVAVIVARSVFGLAFGSSYLTFVMFGSEISSPKVRAQTLFMLHASLTLGMFLFATFSLGDSVTLSMQLSGSIAAALTLFSSALAYFKMKSSHIFLMQNNSKDALERFEYFQQDSTDNPHVESETMQSFIIEEKKRRYDLFGLHNLSALLIILLVKIGYLSIFNALHNFYRLVFMSAFLTAWGVNFGQITLMGARLCGCIAGFVLLDHITKRLQYFIAASVVSIGLFAFGTVLVTYQSSPIWTPMVVFIPLEFALGFGLGPLADILKGELFPLKEKPVSIATAIAFQEVVHIVCIFVLYSWISSLGAVPTFLTFTFASITLVCGVGVLFLLKDSRKQSLRLVSTLYSDK